MSVDKQAVFFNKVTNDFEWYAKKFLRIRNKRSELVPLTLNDAQQEMERLIAMCDREKRLKRFIILKARQMGLSTYTEARIFHGVATQSLKNALIVAHEEKASINLFNMSKLYYEELPSIIRPMKKTSNERALAFENPTQNEDEKKENPGLRSKITIATAGSGEVGRSATNHYLHISELAFFPNARTTMIGLLQSVPDEMNTLVILESTANGVGDYFHEMFVKAMRGENDFIPVFLPWFTDKAYTRPFPTEEAREAFITRTNAVSTDLSGVETHTEEYDLMVRFSLTYEQLNWREYTLRNKCEGDLELFRQEYPSTWEEAFIASGRPKFNIPALRKYQKLCKEPKWRGYLHENVQGAIQLHSDVKGYVQVWQEPVKGTHYCIGADVAEGKITGDYSTAYVCNDKFEIVARFHGHIDPDLYGDELIKLAKYYNDAYLGVENNNHGLTTLKAIQRKEYWNIYYSKNYDKMSDQLSTKMGWTTSVKSKPMMIDKLAEFVREMYLDIPCAELVSEMFTYVIEENGSTNAQAGCHDDTVMAVAIMLQMVLEGRGDNYEPEYSIEKRKSNVVLEIVDPVFEGSEEQDEICI